jgi:hypothetical protein
MTIEGGGKDRPKALEAAVAARGAATVYSIVTGIGAAITGVAGGELRLPALVHLLRMGLRSAMMVNLVINIGVLTIGIFLRLFLFDSPPGLLPLGLVLMASSIPGAWFGSRLSFGAGERMLRLVLIGLLTFVLVRVILGDGTGSPLVVASGMALPLAAIIGFGTAFIGGLVGVGGGQYRIPALVFLLGYGFRDAGTLSLLAALTTVLTASPIHSHRVPPDQTTRAGLLWVGLPSVVAVVPGVLLLAGPEELIRLVFAAILIFIIASFVWDSAPHGKPCRSPIRP